MSRPVRRKRALQIARRAVDLDCYASATVKSPARRSGFHVPFRKDSARGFRGIEVKLEPVTKHWSEIE
jgi:hypothetical protein